MTETRSKFIRLFVPRLVGASLLSNDGVSSIVKAAIPEDLETITINGYSFKQMTSVNGGRKLFYIPNTHIESDMKNDYKIASALIKNEIVQAYADEALLIIPEFEYKPESLLRVYQEYFAKDFANLLISENICVFGTQDLKAHETAVRDLVAYIKKEYAEVFQDCINVIEKHTERNPSTEYWLNKLNKSFGKTHMKYRNDVKEYESKYGHITKDKANFTRRQARENITFQSIEKAFDLGFNNIGITYGKQHAESFISHFQKICNVYVGQEEDIPLKPKTIKDSYLPPPVQKVISEYNKLERFHKELYKKMILQKADRIIHPDSQRLLHSPR
ncbi:hypothetical protein JXA85_02295 [Candidatus Woesearchaeota archaeon]|nr:hypothetical protein [Candidatus Woesearchaeota archaeon]